MNLTALKAALVELERDAKPGTHQRGAAFLMQHFLAETAEIIGVNDKEDASEFVSRALGLLK